jgi:hypothetical protein
MSSMLDINIYHAWLCILIISCHEKSKIMIALNITYHYLFQYALINNWFCKLQSDHCWVCRVCWTWWILHSRSKLNETTKYKSLGIGVGINANIFFGNHSMYILGNGGCT